VYVGAFDQQELVVSADAGLEVESEERAVCLTPARNSANNRTSDQYPNVVNRHAAGAGSSSLMSLGPSQNMSVATSLSSTGGLGTQSDGALDSSDRAGGASFAMSWSHSSKSFWRQFDETVMRPNFGGHSTSVSSH